MRFLVLIISCLILGVWSKSLGRIRVSSQSSGVLATRHGAYEVGSCELPAWSYSSNYAVALGDISSLGDLSMRSDLCGHVLTIDCGNGELDIVINNSNFGGGLDLYASTWDEATNSLPPGQTYCDVWLSDRNVFGDQSGPLCFYATGETNNEYYHKLGLLNTGSRIVSAARLNGMQGYHDGNNNPYFVFGGYASKSDQVTFEFEDGGESVSLPLADCLSGADKKFWS